MVVGEMGEGGYMYYVLTGDLNMVRNTEHTYWSSGGEGGSR